MRFKVKCALLDASRVLLLIENRCTQNASNSKKNSHLTIQRAWFFFLPQAFLVQPARSFAGPLRRALFPFCIILELIHLHVRRIFDTGHLAQL